VTPAPPALCARRRLAESNSKQAPHSQCQLCQLAVSKRLHPALSFTTCLYNQTWRDKHQLGPVPLAEPHQQMSQAQVQAQDQQAGQVQQQQQQAGQVQQAHAQPVGRHTGSTHTATASQQRAGGAGSLTNPTSSQHKNLRGAKLSAGAAVQAAGGTAGSRAAAAGLLAAGQPRHEQHHAQVQGVAAGNAAAARAVAADARLRVREAARNARLQTMQQLQRDIEDLQAWRHRRAPEHLVVKGQQAVV